MGSAKIRPFIPPAAPRFWPRVQLWSQFYDFGQKTGRIGALADMDLEPPRLQDAIEIRANERQVIGRAAATSPARALDP